MPRYRFRWENLDPAVLRALAAHDGSTDEERARSLRATFGARPRADFVAETWPTLRDVWLAADAARRARVVRRLRAAGLGRDDIDVATDLGQVRYLASCRNSSTLRAVVLEELIAAGEGGSASDAPAPGGARPTEPAAAPQVDEQAVATALTHPENPEQLRAQVAATLQALLQTDELLIDEDGDIPLGWGSVTVYVHVLDDAPVVRCWAVVLDGVTLTTALRDAINEINRTRWLVKALWADGLVVLTADVFASPYVGDHVVNVLRALADTADALDDELAATFPPPDPHDRRDEGYL